MTCNQTIKVLKCNSQKAQSTQNSSKLIFMRVRRKKVGESLAVSFKDDSVETFNLKPWQVNARMF